MRMDSIRTVADILSTRRSVCDLSDSIATGLKFEDHELRLVRGQLCVIAGRPSMGISALASKIALQTSIHHNLPTLYFSLDLSAQQLVTRLVSAMAAVDYGHLVVNQTDTNEQASCDRAAETLRSAPLFIDDTPAISVKAIRQRIEMVYSEHCCRDDTQLGVIVVDDLQGIAPLYRPDAPEKAYRRVVSALREIAQEFRAPVLLLSRLSRRLGRAKDNRPLLTDFPSAVIPLLADHVLALYREGYYYPESAPPEQADLYVLRNRRDNGFQVHCWPLNFLGSQLRFESRPSQRSVS